MMVVGPRVALHRFGFAGKGKRIPDAHSGREVVKVAYGAPLAAEEEWRLSLWGLRRSWWHTVGFMS